jgi:hypothetical protein
MTATLVILRDPAGILGREVHNLHRDATLQQQIEAAMPGGGAECELLINGERADPMTDPRLDEPPQAGDCIVIAHRPAGFDPVTIALIAGALLAVASYAMIPKVPDTPVASDSPNNRLTGQTNVARAYQAIPDVYGQRRVWPDMIQPSTVEYRNNVKFVTEWLCVSRGEGAISDVKFADTPIDDVDDAEWALYEPGGSPPPPSGVIGPIAPPPALSPPIPGIPAGYAEGKATRLTGVTEAFASDDVNGQELTAAQAYGLVQAGFPTSYSGTTTVTMTFSDGAHWNQIRAAPLPLTVSRFRFQRSFGGATFNVTRTGSITSISTSAGVVTLVCTITSALGQSLPFTVSIQPAGVSAFNKVGPFTLPIADATRIRWNTTFLRGLKGSVSILAEWWKIDSGGTEIAGSRETQTIFYDADTFDAQYRTTEVEPAAGAGRYRIEFTRQNTPNADGSDVATLEELYAARYYSVKDIPLGVTIIRVTTRATERSTGLRERKFNCLWERRVRTLTGDTASASRNFARAMAHLWTISGQPISELDTAALAAINTALGETNALLRFDGSLDDADVSLLERMQLMANHARCVFWRDGTRWTVTRDQARSAPELQLDYRNLAGSGQSVVNESFHLPASQDGVEVEFVDEATGAKKAYYRLNITSGTPVVGVCANPLRVKMPACTTLAQAINRAQLEARKLLFQRTSITDTALGDAQQLGPGSLVRWVDPNDFAGDDGLQAGEVLAIAGSVITTSEPLDFKGQTSGRIQVTNADGMLAGPPVVCTPVAGDPYRVTLASVPAGLFVAAPPASQVGSRYAFAVGLTGAEVEAAGLYTVTEPRPNGDGTWSLSMVTYDPRVYAAD